AFAEAGDGRILLGGHFLGETETQFRSLVRLDRNGEFDRTLRTGSGFNDDVMVIALQTDGKILIGESFGNAAGFIRYRVRRLESDGAQDPSFHPDAFIEQ